MNKIHFFPFRMALVKAKRILPQKHDGITICLMIQGEMTIHTKRNQYHLSRDDIYLVNPHESFGITGEGNNLFLYLEISRAQLEDYLKKKWQPSLNCSSISESKTVEQEEQFQKLRETLVHLMVAYFKENEEYEFEINQHLFSLLARLVKEFQEEKALSNHLPENISDDKVAQIMDWVSKNYSQSISLERLAEDHFVSYSHLSRSFKKYLGVTFTDYLNQVRLMHAAEDLRLTDSSVLKVAINSGFADAKIFHKVFKKYYEQTPMSYRKAYKEQEQIVDIPGETSDYQELVGEDALQELSKYLVEKDIDDENAVIEEDIVIKIPTNASKYVKTRKIINIGLV